VGRSLGILLAAGLLVLPGCASADHGADGAGGGAADLAHVHGLGVDPGDGVLYAGTHHGLFRVTDDAVEGPVGGLVQDFMGFTVAGDGRFLASGHPGPGQPGPGALGLLESTDAGQTWETRSLAGEADFHALELRHGRTWGLNAMTGELVTSTDLRTWDTLARPRTQTYDVAVSPHDADTLLLTTQEGPFLSTDGGASFAPMAGAAPVALVSWADDGTLVGVEAGGGVHVLPAESDAWESRGDLGAPPEAVHAVDAQTVYAAADGKLWRSTDGGATFSAYPSE
jgi:hypothetical protein